MSNEEILRLAKEYLADNWEGIVADIAALVSIPSFKEEGKADAAAGAPWGPGPKEALEAGLGLAERFGFAPVNLNGRIAYADLAGTSETQLGIIGHMDVVPAGPGWDFEPFALTRKDGYLLGRGVIDDKGPSVVALHAAHFVSMHAEDFFGSEKLPCTVRFIFGADEECGMGDVPYYRVAQPDPAFLFTPDAEFPVCHGEKGHFDASLVSEKLDGCIVSFEGGTAPNAVPGLAKCVIRAGEHAIPAAERIMQSVVGEGLLELEAHGLSAHASTPEGGINAIGLLVEHLLEFAPLSSKERDFLELESKIMASTAGEGVGLKASDADFGSLTLVAGQISFEEGHLRQSIDCRYPTSIGKEELEARLSKLACEHGAELVGAHAQEPFLVKADSPEIQALLDAYCQVTGEDTRPFTMGGGTYAREFTNAASFGPEFPNQENPSWVGGMHGPNEGVSEESLKQAFLIYCLAIVKLAELL